MPSMPPKAAVTTSDTSPAQPPSRRRYGGVLPEERQRQRHDKLIEGGIELFGTKGFHATTVREVCMAAHLTERYFYESFESLAALFVEVFNHLREQLMTRTLEAMMRTPVTSPLSLLDPSLRVFLEFIRDDPRRGRIMLVDALGVDANVAKLSGEAARDYSGLLRQHLESLVPADKRDLIDVDLLSDGLIGLNILLAARWMQDGFKAPIDTVVRTNMLPYEGMFRLLAEMQG